MLFTLDIILLLIGLFIIIRENNLIKKVIGLNIFQASVFIFYLIISKTKDGVPPILIDNEAIYSNPLPHVLILTAIVVGIATTSLALALIVSIKKEHKTIEEDELDEI
ncbi:MAG: cation:proton antiporter subunit C [Pseudomonadota bacterium]|mgnify:FL=1|nr:cation:proton antiporter subunit C [Pseudomonadota bacterium]